MGKTKTRDDSICLQIEKTICSEIGKRLRSYKSIRSCTSLRSSLLYRRPDFIWFEEDIWTEIAKYLDRKCMVMLGSSCHWFRRLISGEDSVRKFACLHDLQVPWFRQQVSFKWIQLYASAFDGSHSYMFRQQEKHIVPTEKLPLLPRLPRGESVEKMLQKTGSCILNNIKTGIWIARYHSQWLYLIFLFYFQTFSWFAVPVCNLDTCERTMQTLDARHVELFLIEGYKSGSWDYKEIGSYQIRTHSDRATGAIFDIMHLKEGPGNCRSVRFEEMGSKTWQPKAQVACHNIELSTPIFSNGLHVRYHAMRAGEEDDSEVISIRISQQLL
ncbi:hypothetical protein MKW98_012489 [Papaver atlanticum]|uniref:F-box protein n=1 Tax=Papaver atlanticum TaxID=357466 RepID=A0AAD4XCL0_9MAGN|nr:hypothetical protein MKW98_012489 [Papaver atlanticum]